MDKNIGKRLDGRYEVMELIGIGGMADVYKAVDILDDKIVAIKILKNEFSTNDDFIRRFRNESKAIAVLSHPNIVKIFDVGFTDKIQFIVMEYIDGITLKEFIEQQNVLKWKDCVHFIIQILRALQHAHDRGIVHRDIKPQNIMLFPDGTIKVMDFGIARFAREEGKTISDKAIGSVHYISPEQARGDITDEKSDIYSVGIMLYEMLTGVKPFDADNPVSVALMHMQTDIKNPREVNDSIPEGLEEIVIRATQKDSSKRYQAASEMIKDIEEFKKNPSIVFEYKYISDKTQYFNTGSTPKASAAASGYKAVMQKSGEKPERKQRAKTKVKSKRDDYDGYEDNEDDETVSKSSYFVVALTAIAAGIIIIVVVFIAVIILGKIIPPSVPVEKGSMPNIMGQDYQMTKSTYASNFKLSIEREEYSSEHPAGYIISQSLEEGREYIVGESQVSVIVSRGKQMMPVPNVYELEAEAARTLLENPINGGFTVQINLAFDEVVEKDEVIRTEPARNESAEAGSLILMYVSRGPQEQDIIMPNVVGMKIDAAKTALEKLTVEELRVDSIEPEGMVIEQSVPPRDEFGNPVIVQIKSRITLTVSSGKPPMQEAVITFPIPSGLSDGLAVFNCYINGQLAGTTSIDNIAYAATVSVTVSGSEVQRVMLEAVNKDKAKKATIGEYLVDFVINEVNETDFKRSTLITLFTLGQETTAAPYDPFAPWPPVESDTEVIYDNDFFSDNQFWNDIF